MAKKTLKKGKKIKGVKTLAKFAWRFGSGLKNETFRRAVGNGSPSRHKRTLI